MIDTLIIMSPLLIMFTVLVIFTIIQTIDIHTDGRAFMSKLSDTIISESADTYRVRIYMNEKSEWSRFVAHIKSESLNTSVKKRSISELESAIKEEISDNEKAQEKLLRDLSAASTYEYGVIDLPKEATK